MRHGSGGENTCGPCSFGRRRQGRPGWRAVEALIDAGYRPQRVSGTSAGSIVGAIVAAASKRADVTGEQVKEVALGLNHRKFLDPGRIESIPLLGPAVGDGAGQRHYRGDYAHQWIRGELKNLGVSTFGDLAIDDDSLPEERRYRLGLPSRT